MDINVNGNATVKKTMLLGFASGIATTLGMAAGAILGFKALDIALPSKDEKTTNSNKS